jgi:hypothetical protein
MINDVGLGDLVICRQEIIGLVIDIDDYILQEDNLIWVKVFWADGSITWEDLVTSKEDDVFQIIRLL